MIMAFIQARMSSSRLPGKVFKPIQGRPMLELELERVRSCRSIDGVAVVTTTHADDQPIVDLGRRLNVGVFCGSMENVLNRFYQAAKKFRPDHVVRITGDCPLIDPVVVDEMVRLYLEQGGDYGTNCMPPTYPDGLDAEIFSFQALELAHAEAVLPSHLEHISLFFEEQPERFKIVNLAHSEDLSHLRWTVDEPEDYEFVKGVFAALYPANPCFGFRAVLAVLEQNPELMALNRHFERNEGLIKSKEEDRAFLERSDQAKD
ncbi:cytidylyltransferase domain-containing protein [Thermodesulfobacteriota bacterium]